MNVELNIQHYQMNLNWSDNDQPPFGTWQVCVFPRGKGGKWSDHFPTVAEAVADCLMKNGYPVIETSSALRR